MQITKYLSEVRLELSKVIWPTRPEAIHMTIVVIVVSLLVGLYIGSLDLAFTSLLGLFIK